MAEPSRNRVKPLVIRNISVVSGVEEHRITEDKSLDIDLHMSQLMRKALAPGFGAIAREFNPDARFTMSECGKLKTVGESVDLVHARARKGG